MAKFIVNSEGRKAIRKDEVRNLEIDYDPSVEGVNPQPASWKLHVYFIQGLGHLVIFESSPTLEGIQVLAANVMAALEE